MPEKHPPSCTSSSSRFKPRNSSNPARRFESDLRRSSVVHRAKLRRCKAGIKLLHSARRISINSNLQPMATHYSAAPLPARPAISHALGLLQAPTRAKPSVARHLRLPSEQKLEISYASHPLRPQAVAVALLYPAHVTAPESYIPLNLLPTMIQVEPKCRVGARNAAPETVVRLGNTSKARKLISCTVQQLAGRPGAAAGRLHLRGPQ